MIYLLSAIFEPSDNDAYFQCIDHSGFEIITGCQATQFRTAYVSVGIGGLSIEMCTARLSLFPHRMLEPLILNLDCALAIYRFLKDFFTPSRHSE
jgi:hypothetical protein